MDLRYPRNSAELVALRKGREVPALPVLVSLVGPLSWSNVTLQAIAGEPYDWRLLLDLNVEVFVDSNTPFVDLLRTLSAIAAAVPRTMVLAFLEGPRVHCGEMRTVPGQDFALFDWFPMAIGPSDYLAASKIEKSLWAEMGRSIPIPFDDACELVVQVVTEQAQEQTPWHA